MCVALVHSKLNVVKYFLNPVEMRSDDMLLVTTQQELEITEPSDGSLSRVDHVCSMYRPRKHRGLHSLPAIHGSTLDRPWPCSQPDRFRSIFGTIWHVFEGFGFRCMAHLYHTKTDPSTVVVAVTALSSFPQFWFVADLARSSDSSQTKISNICKIIMLILLSATLVSTG